ncbi:hypothetical protein N8I77_006819 [Diaporthe amygdali]|uniref:Heterokaryon incompatibility domain-containing protein n=1 Tax=Phomopsis amygdali TaxID=1214568 RepID=A0AAD9SI60_PHOAM|nr:hypothetical protein N8I77_006819 [Diaporthe amygdali]
MKADVIVIDAMPTCLSCGSFYSRDETDNFGELHKGQSQVEETSANLNLDWPPTIEFSSPDEVEDASTRDTLKQLGNILEERQQRQQGFDQSREDNSEISPRSSGTGSHGDLLEKLNLGTSSDHKGVEQGQKEHPSKTTNETKSVIYDPLTGVDEIRLLYLSPSKFTHDEVLHGTLVTTSLSARPIYTALSYTWANADGSRSLSEEIFLGNLWTPLPITSNCAAALRRIRSVHEIKILWVDSVCMDQLSTSEKSHQVGLMRDNTIVYSRASSVTVFLGDDEETPDARLLKKTSENVFYSGTQGDVTWDAWRDEMAVRALFDRPYWSRVWVVQEILLSKEAEVVLGNSSIPLQSLLKARLVEPNKSNRAFNIPSWLRLRKILPIEDFHGFSTLLNETSSCLAADSKDKVFALLGLVQGAHLEGLAADYSKSAAEINIGIAAYFLTRHGQGNILKQAAYEDKWEYSGPVPGSPSWVPSWTSSNRPNFADDIDRQFREDQKRDTFSTDRDETLRYYDTIRPRSASHTSLDYSRRKGFSFRVLQGTGALLVEAYPVLRYDRGLGALKFCHIRSNSVILTPSTSAVKWAIYAARDGSDPSHSFALQDDWIVEVPNCDDFLLLRPIDALPGVYRIVAVCGLAIAVAWNDGEGFQSQRASPHAPSYRGDELVSRLITFDQQEFLFLDSWAHSRFTNVSHSPSSDTVGTETIVVSSPLLAVDRRRYAQWVDHISHYPEAEMDSAGLEHTLKKVSIYLDRWQDLARWNRMISELEAVPWPEAFRALAEIRMEIWPDQSLPETQPSDSRQAEGTSDRSLPPVENFEVIVGNLRYLLSLLTNCGISLRQVGTMNALGLLLDTDASSILEVLRANEVDIESGLRELESQLEYMRDSLPMCNLMREKFIQRQFLRQLYMRREHRDFLIC